MKSIKNLILLFAILQFIACSAAAPPVSIPAPTATGISVSTDGTGTTYIVGTPGSVEADATVEVTIEEASASFYQNFFIANAYASTPFCSTQAESDGSFLCSGTASPGATLCIKQITSLGGISSCTNIVVPEHTFAHKFSELTDIYLDSSQDRTYVLGKNLSGEYSLKVYDNDTEFLLSTFDLVSLINDSSAILTSVTAMDDTIMITDHHNEKIYTLSLASGSITHTSSNVCTLGGLPSYIRVDTPDATGNPVDDYLLVCEDSSTLYLQKNTIANHSLLQSTSVVASVVSYLGISSPGREEWILLIEQSNGVAQRLLITDGVQIILSVNQLNLSGGLYRSNSSGFSTVAVAQIERLPLVSDTTATASFLDSNAQSQQSLILDTGVDAVDVVCEAREICDVIFVLGDDHHVYKVQPGQSLQFSDSFEVNLINPVHIIMNEAQAKLIIFDLDGQAILWQDVSQF